MSYSFSLSSLTIDRIVERLFDFELLNMFELGTSETIQEVTKYENSFGIRRNWGIPSNGLSLLVSNAGSKVLIFTNANCEQRWCAIPTGGIQNCKTSDWNLNPKTLQECGNCSKSIKHMTFTFWPLRMNDRFSLRGNLECDLQDNTGTVIRRLTRLNTYKGASHPNWIWTGGIRMERGSRSVKICSPSTYEDD